MFWEFGLENVTATYIAKQKLGLTSSGAALMISLKLDVLATNGDAKNL
jgi:hypothetical protein